MEVGGRKRKYPGIGDRTGREEAMHPHLPAQPVLDLREWRAHVPRRCAEGLGELLQQEQIVGHLTYELEDRLLRIRVEGCVHRPIEAQMLERGVEPFTCVPANLVVLAIEEKLDRPVELAEIKIEEGACQLLLVLFDKRPTLG